MYRDSSSSRPGGFELQQQSHAAPLAGRTSERGTEPEREQVQSAITRDVARRAGRDRAVLVGPGSGGEASLSSSPTSSSSVSSVVASVRSRVRTLSTPKTLFASSERCEKKKKVQDAGTLTGTFSFISHFFSEKLNSFPCTFNLKT
jgi:hypothetical protein